MLRELLQNRCRRTRRHTIQITGGIGMNPVEVRNIKIGEGIPKICVPIVGVTKEDIIAEAKTFDSIPVDVGMACGLV